MMEDRNITKMDVEFYLLNREYSELTSEEYAIVKEHVESEQEFNEMKAVLLGAGDFFKEEKELEPNPAIKAALLKEFSKQQPARSYWLNGIFVSLFPKEKKLYQKPGMQLIGLAASVLLVVTIVFDGNNEMNSNILAQNEEVKTKEQTINEVKELDKRAEEVEEDDEKEVLKQKEELSKELLAEKEIELDGLKDVKMDEEFDSEITVVGGTTFTYDAQPSEDVISDFSTIAADNEINNRSNNISANSSDGFYRKEPAKKNVTVIDENDKLVISATTIATSEIVEETIVLDEAVYFSDDASVASGSSVAPSGSNNGVDLPVNSRTLAEDADLIGILYTAM